MAPTKKTHGMSKTSDYKIWSGMKNRCYSKTSKDYENYGGRGIRVCDKWLTSFENFLEDMGARKSTEYSIERRDVDGDYTPENCYWLKKTKQARNRRNTLYITYEGETKPLSEWSKVLKIKHSTLHKRLYKYGWSLEKTFTTPPDAYRKGKVERTKGNVKYIECFGIKWTLKVWSEISGLKRSTITGRINRGWSPEKAVITPV